MEITKAVYQSHINTYDNCSMSYYFNKVLRLRPIKQEHDITRFGATVHNLISSYYKMFPKKKVTEENINNRIENMFENHVLKFKQKKRFRTAITAFKLFELKRFHKFGAENYLPIICEETLKGTFFIDDMEIPIAVKMDALYPNGLMVDWKCGNRLGHSVVQSGLSMMIAEQNGYKPQMIFAFLVLEKFITSKQSDIIGVKRHLTSFVNGLKSDLFVRNPNPLCRWCGYQSVCRYESDFQKMANDWFDVRGVKNA